MKRWRQCEGAVTILALNAAADRVLAVTEIPASLVDNSKITSINERPIEFWRVVANEGGSTEVGLAKTVDAIAASSDRLLAGSGMGVLLTSTGEVIGLDTANGKTYICFNTSGVRFDLESDGTPDLMLWTEPTYPLLLTDLDGDGRISRAPNSLI
ncbi:hypothetical protein [Aquabacterium sp.]|uniref:hypothetical protein n=1 Tax=Aquabacterium sp. TaxID=1872578 RepID=UPI004037F2EB